MMSVDVITDPVFDRTTSLAHVVQEQESEVEFNRSISAPSLLEGKHEEDAVWVEDVVVVVVVVLLYSCIVVQLYSCIVV